LIERSITSLEADNDPVCPLDLASNHLAHIRLNQSHYCPLYSESGLCRVQVECGPDLLSHTCATYPRIVHVIGDVDDASLTLSCPEAARLVLLNPALLDVNRAEPVAAPNLPDDIDRFNTDCALDPARLRRWYWPVRESVIALIRNCSYPLWQRLFLLGIFCRRLDSIARGELARSVPEFLIDFSSTLASGNLRVAMETLPIDRVSQLDLVLRMAGLLLHRSTIGPRFVDCISAFTTGLGNGPQSTLETLAAQYTAAHDRYYAPFFYRYPHILENYLVNTIIRCQFPFGREAMRAQTPNPAANSSFTNEYALLAAQFALTKGLLIGVSGFHQDDFASSHVVHTIQAASRHFEHHPEFLSLARTLLAESGMDGARGLAILLRDPDPAAIKREPDHATQALRSASYSAVRTA
jgi:lysine-N-methylase